MDDIFVRVGRGFAVTHPRSRLSTGFALCSFCGRQILEGETLWIQRERLDGFLRDGIKRYCESHKSQLIEIPSAENPHP